jgi:hypothetical protein
MAIKCPNKSAAEWKSLVKKYGERQSYVLYWSNDSNIPSLDRAKELLGKLPNTDRFILGDVELPISYSKELFDSFETYFLKQLFNNFEGDLDQAFKSTTKLAPIMDKAFEDLLNALYTSSELRNKPEALRILNLLEDEENEGAIEYMKDVVLERLQKYGVEFKTETNKNPINEDDENHDFVDTEQSEDSTESRNRTDIDHAIYYNTKTGFPRTVKLMLGTITKVDNDNNVIYSPNLGLASRDLEIENYLLGRLADVPWNITEQLKRLQDLQSEKPNLIQVFNRLGGIELTNVNTAKISQLRLRQQFSQSFGKHKYEFLINQLKTNGDFVITDSNQASVQKQIRQRWESNYLNTISQFKTNEEIYKWFKNYVNTGYEELPKYLGIEVSNQNLFDENTEEGKGPVLNSHSGTFINTIAYVIDRVIEDYENSIKANTEPKDLRKIFKQKMSESYIAGYMNELVEYVSLYEHGVDLQLINGEGKNVFSINLHTYQSLLTSLMNFNPNGGLKNDLPFLDNAYTQNSVWLDHVKRNGSVNITLLDGYGIQNEPGKHVSDLREADLGALIVNALMRNVYPAIKHSDRSMFPGYKVDIEDFNINNKKDGRELKITKEGMHYTGNVIDKFKDIIVGYLLDELNRSRLDAPYIDQYNTNKKKSEVDNLGFNLNKDTSFILDINWDDYSGQATKEAIMNNYSRKINEFVTTYIDNTIKAFDSYGLFVGGKKRKLEDGEVVMVPDSKFPIVGVSKDILDLFKDKTGEENYKKVAENVVAFAAIKYFIGAQEQFKLFLGDPAFYKISFKKGQTIFDIAKRSNMQSSSKNVTSVDAETNATISNWNREDLIELPTGEIIEYKNGQADGTFTEIVLADDNFTTAFENHIINLYGKDSSKHKAYKEFVENDGITLVNFFFTREFQHRRSDWDDRKQNTFKLELRIFNEVFPLKTEDERFRKLAEILEFPTDDEFIKAYTTIKDGDMKYNYEKIFSEYYGAFTTEKPQYLGPNYGMSYEAFKQLKPEERLNVMSGRKTSYQQLLPSTVMGTILEDALVFMLRNGIDTLPFNSAAKFGSKLNDKGKFRSFYKIVKDENGNEFTDGFNDAPIENNTIGVLDYRFLGKQQEIHEFFKEEITASTQDRKNKVFGLLDDGKPITYKGTKEEWDNLSEEDKLKNELYKQLQEYKIAQSEIIIHHLNELKDEFGAVENMSIYGDSNYSIKNPVSFINVLLKNARERSSPDNVIQSLQNWLDSNGNLKYIETLPNYRSIQFILNSIMTNRVLKEKRPGTAMPQIPSTGFEKKGTKRRIVDGKILSQNDLNPKERAVSYYTIDDKGELNPAEIMMPLPVEWIQKFFNYYKKAGINLPSNNIAILLDRINEDLQAGLFETELTFKALRIPHQQVSSTDVVRVKKFLYPHFQSGVIVPSELVVKTGGDFDIDKLNIYFPNTNESFKSVGGHNTPLDVILNTANKEKRIEKLQNFILQVEKDLLLKYQQDRFLSPIADTPLQQVRETLTKVSKNKNHIFEMDSLIDQTLTFLGGKGGVGILATWITFSSIAQMHNIYLLPTKYSELHWEYLKDNYRLSNIKSQDGNFIDDVLSALLTSQVDLVKDPYARDLMLNTQTLNLVSYLTLRGVKIADIVDLLTAPIIIDYLKEQRINESDIYKNTNNKLTKNDLHSKVTKKYKNEEDIETLNNFLRYVDNAKDISSFKQYLSADTKYHKDLNSIDLVEDLRVTLQDEFIIPTKHLHEIETNSILSSFIKARKDTLALYNPLYLSRINTFKKNLNLIKKALAGKRNTDVRNKVYNIIDEEFINYLIQIKNSDFKDSFERLFIGANNLPKRLQKYKKKNKDNYLINSLIPIFSNNTYDLDKIRLYFNKLTTPESNELIAYYSNLKNENPELYKDIILFNTFLNGVSPSPFQLAKILPYQAQQNIFNPLNDISERDFINFQDFFNKVLTIRPEIIPTDKESYKLNLKISDKDGKFTTVRFPMYKGYDFNDNRMYVYINDNSGTKMKPGKDYNNNEFKYLLDKTTDEYYKTLMGLIGNDELSKENNQEDTIEEQDAQVINTNQSENVVSGEVNGKKPAVENDLKAIALNNKGKQVSIKYDKYKQPFNAIITGKIEQVVSPTELRYDDGRVEYKDDGVYAIQIETNTGKILTAQLEEITGLDLQSSKPVVENKPINHIELFKNKMLDMVEEFKLEGKKKVEAINIIKNTKIKNDEDKGRLNDRICKLVGKI